MKTLLSHAWYSFVLAFGVKCMDGIGQNPKTWVYHTCECWTMVQEITGANESWYFRLTFLFFENII